MSSTWKKIKSTKLFEHPRLSLFEDDVELPNGKKTKYLHYGDHHTAAMVIGLKGKKIFLQKEYSYPPNEWLFQFPGGAVDDGEAIEAGAAREFAEEAKMAGTLTQIGGFYLNNRRSDKKFYVFVATDVREDHTAEEDGEEAFEDFWFTPNEINTMIRNGEITNQTLLAAWALFINSTFYTEINS